MLDFILFAAKAYIFILFIQFIYYILSSIFKQAGNSFCRMMYWIVGEEPPISLRKDKNSHQEL